jgi:hypothetical protein
VHDGFNFEEELGEGVIGLRYWNCEALAFSESKKDGYTFLNNEFFREFRDQYGQGGDFLVLSQPHSVENFRGMPYAYTCSK